MMRYCFEIIQFCFTRFGYSKEDFNSTEDWDVMWAHDYPFKKIREKMLAMRPGQKVNKFITDKETKEVFMKQLP